MLTVLAAALIVGGLVRLATDDRIVEVVSFREAEADASELAASLQPLSLSISAEQDEARGQLAAAEAQK